MRPDGDGDEQIAGGTAVFAGVALSPDEMVCPLSMPAGMLA